MNPAKKDPYKIVRAGGREFRLHREYDEDTGQDVLVYPDFVEAPAFTGEGRPFRTAADEGCVYGKPQNPDDAPPGGYATYGDCGGCAYFYREEPYAIIGVCMNDAFRRTLQTAEEQGNENPCSKEDDPHAKKEWREKTVGGAAGTRTGHDTGAGCVHRPADDGGGSDY